MIRIILTAMAYAAICIVIAMSINSWSVLVAIISLVLAISLLILLADSEGL